MLLSFKVVRWWFIVKAFKKLKFAAEIPQDKIFLITLVWSIRCIPILIYNTDRFLILSAKIKK